jgi:hypothetical protein
MLNCNKYILETCTLNWSIPFHVSRKETVLICNRQLVCFLAIIAIYPLLHSFLCLLRRVVALQ